MNMAPTGSPHIPGMVKLMTKRPLLLIALVLPTISRFAAAAELAGSADRSVILHVTFQESVAPAVGEALSLDAQGSITYMEREGGFGARLGEPIKDHKLLESKRKVQRKKQEAPALAAWKLGNRLNSAVGTMALRVRAPQAVGAEGTLRLRQAEAALWTISFGELPWTPREKSVKELAKEAEGLAPKMDLPGEVDAGEPGATEGDAAEDISYELGDKRKPVVFFVANGPVSVQKALTAASAWHSVVWTWSSVRNRLYLDGKLVKSSTAISRRDPFESAKLSLELLPGVLDVDDLRVYDRELAPEEVVSLAAAPESRYLPAPASMSVWAQWGQATGRMIAYVDVSQVRGVVSRANLAVVDVKSGEALKEVTMESFPSRLGEMAISVAEPEMFPDGTYRLSVTAFDEKGRKLAAARSADWTTDKLSAPWLGCRIGIDKKVRIIPPYKPLAIDAEKRVVRAVLRDHTLSRSGLPAQITAKGKELLSAPVQIELMTGGKALAFGEGPGVTGMKVAGQVAGETANWSAITRSAEGHELRVEGYMEYDGVTRLDVTLSPQGRLPIGKGVLRVPYHPEVLQFIQSIASGWMHHQSRLVRTTEGKWEIAKICWNYRGGNPPPVRGPDVAFNSQDPFNLHDPNLFTPYFYGGNYERGLTWFAVNDKGWVHDRGVVMPLELVRTDDECYLRLNVIAKPTTLTKPWSIRFYLLASPFKPLPKKWYTWAIATQGRNKLYQNTTHRFWWHWNEYADSFRPYPKDKDFASWGKRFKGDGVYHTPFINFGTPAGSEYLYGKFFPETKVLPYSWKLHNNRPTCDYMVYWLHRSAVEAGIRGVYIDEPYCEPRSYNVLAGDQAYIREDGTRGIGYRFMEGRNYIRRLKQMFVDLGIDYSLWLHSTNYKCTPIHTFMDISMDGEFPNIWVTKFDDYRVFYNPWRSGAFICGKPSGCVGTQMLNGNFNHGLSPWATLGATRTYLGVTMPYHVVPENTNYPDELNRICNLLYEFGLYDDEIEELPFYDHQKWLPGSEMDVVYGGGVLGGYRHRSKGRAILFGGNDWGRPIWGIPPDWKGLDLGKPHVRAWNPENGYPVRSDAKGSPIVSYLYGSHTDGLTVTWLEGADTPSPDIPEGTVLAASFDESIEPDLGGGFMPTTVAKDAERPKLAPGRRGKAIEFQGNAGALRFPVVPDWTKGSLEFWLSLEGLRMPTTLCKLTHYADFQLSFVPREDVLSLELACNEDAFQPEHQAKLKAAAAARFELGEDHLQKWNHVALTWWSGQYTVYWNGKELGALSRPPAPRFRDGVAPVSGLSIGPDGPLNRGRLAVDSLVLYDFVFSASDAKAAASRNSTAPLAKPADLAKRWNVAWWGNKNDMTVMANTLNHDRPFNAASVKFFRKDRPKLPLLTGTLSYKWTRTDIVNLQPAKLPAKLEVTIDEGEEPEIDEGDDLGQPYVLQVDLLHRQRQRGKPEKVNVIDTKKIEIEFQMEMEAEDAF